MSKVLAICNRKGGSGKTTTAVNLAAALSHRGHSVLLVDADSQAHATLSVGLSIQNGTPDLSKLLLGQISLESVVMDTYLPRLKLVPASKHLFLYERANAQNKEHLTRLAACLRAVNGQFDYVVIDTPPVLGLMTFASLFAADEVIVPTQTHYLSMEGLAELVSAAATVSRARKRHLPVSGVVPTFFNERTRMSRAVIHEIREQLGGSAILGPVRTNVSLAEAPGFGQTIFQYDHTSNGATDYMRVATQIEEQHGR
jgi:chromosome partitioning protein